MSKKIILLIGTKSNSGKGTVAETMESHFKNINGINVVRCSLSTFIRNLAKNSFYWDGIDTDKSRWFMAEMYRVATNFYPYHMARRVWEREIQPNLVETLHNIIIVESFREKVNYDYFKQLWYSQDIDAVITINIVRPDFSSIEAEELKKHQSEQDLANFDFDYVIQNDSDLTFLKSKSIDVANLVLNDYGIIV